MTSDFSNCSLFLPHSPLVYPLTKHRNVLDECALGVFLRQASTSGDTQLSMLKSSSVSHTTLLPLLTRMTLQTRPIQVVENFKESAPREDAVGFVFFLNWPEIEKGVCKQIIKHPNWANVLRRKRACFFSTFKKKGAKKQRSKEAKKDSNAPVFSFKKNEAKGQRDKGAQKDSNAPVFSVIYGFDPIEGLILIASGNDTFIEQGGAACKIPLLDAMPLRVAFAWPRQLSAAHLFELGISDELSTSMQILQHEEEVSRMILFPHVFFSQAAGTDDVTLMYELARYQQGTRKTIQTLATTLLAAWEEAKKKSKKPDVTNPATVSRILEAGKVTPNAAVSQQCI